jgi:peptidoglycan/xylan/chitin deacetylase (PgdA/CDA1 family)
VAPDKKIESTMGTRGKKATGRKKASEVEFDGLYREGKLMVPVMYPQLSGRVHRVDMLERLLKYILDHSGVWSTKCDEIAEYWRRSTPFRSP